MLKVTVKGEVPKMFDMKKPVRVGSGEGVDLRIDHESVGRVHALFAKQEKTVGLIHMEDSVGTSVNGEALSYSEWKTLSHNDEVRFGEVVANVELEEFSVSVVKPLDMDPVLAKEFLSIGAYLTQLGYEEQLFQRIWSGRQQATVLRVKKKNMEKYEKRAEKYQLHVAVASEEPSKEEIDLLIYKDDRIRTLIEGWDKLRDISNLTSAWFMAMLFQWPEKFIDDLLKAAEERK
jgi:pSer/pThr/pTyr-binding forkhead associated (FHA) protein